MDKDITDKSFLITSFFQPEGVDVKCRFSSYTHNGTLAMQLFCRPDDPIEASLFSAGKDPYCIPYGTVTVNLPLSDRLPLAVQFVDENNLPGIGQWLSKNGIAQPTGLYAQSGYCEYQAYKFNAPKQALEEVQTRRNEITQNNIRQNSASMKR